MKDEDREDDVQDQADWSRWGRQLVRPDRVVPLVANALRDAQNMIGRQLTMTEVAAAFVELQLPETKPERRGPRRL